MSEFASQAELERALALGAQAIADEEATMTDHPGTTELVSYQERRLTEAADQRVRRHLAVCEECAREVMALERFDLDQADPELLPSPAEVARGWEVFQQEIARETLRPNLDDVDSLLPPPESLAARLPMLAFAASIMLALGLGYLASGLFRGGDTDYKNPFMVDLLPDGAVTTRDVANTQDFAVPEGMDLLILRLNLGDQTPFADYRAEILDADGEIRWRQEGLKRQPAGQFIVWVGRAEVPTGSYELRLFGIGSSEPKILTTYSFQLRDAAVE